MNDTRQSARLLSTINNIKETQKTLVHVRTWSPLLGIMFLQIFVVFVDFCRYSGVSDPVLREAWPAKNGYKAPSKIAKYREISQNIAKYRAISR